MDYLLLGGLACAAGAAGVLGIALHERMRAMDDISVSGGLMLPPDVTPTIASLLLNNGVYRRSAMSGGVLELQHKGFIEFGEPDSDGKVTIRRLREDAPRSPDQAGLFSALFHRGPTLRVDTTDAAVRDTLHVAQRAQEAAALEIYETRLFERFPLALWPSLGLSALGVALAALPVFGSPAIGGVTRVLLVALAVAGLYAAWATRRTYLSDHKVAIGVAVLVAGGLAFVSAAPIHCAIAAICGVIAGAALGRLPSLSREGRDARRQVAALRDYLRSRKPSQADIEAGPKAASARYAALKPYAVAFGVLHQFGDLHASLRSGFASADAVVDRPASAPPSDVKWWDGKDHSYDPDDMAFDVAFKLAGTLDEMFGASALGTMVNVADLAIDGGPRYRDR